jgi:hypothetical protein
LVLLAAALAAALGASPGAASAVRAGSVVVVTRPEGPPVPATALGVNVEVTDQNLLTPRSIALLKAAGVRVLRFPGGSLSDAYHWATGTFTPGAPARDFGEPAMTFDQFMHGAVQVAHASSLITVNYGTGPSGGGGP